MVIALMSYFPAIFSYLRIFYVLIFLVFLAFLYALRFGSNQSEKHYGAPDTSWDSLPIWPLRRFGPSFRTVR